MKLKEPNFVIVAASAKGGVGKTTTVVNLAVGLSKVYDLTVIDHDPRRLFTKFNDNRENPFKQRAVKNSEELIKFLKDYNGLTIIDLGGYDSDFNREAMLLSELVIFPLTTSDNDIASAEDDMKTLKEIHRTRPEINFSILLNNIHHADKTSHPQLKEVTDNIGFNIFDTVITSSVVQKRMILSGKSVTEQTKNTPALQVDDLVKEVMEIIEKDN